MAKTKKKRVKKKSNRTPSSSEPRFPYTTKPASLRRLLSEIPKKPKPPKYDKELLKGWGFSDTNDYSMLRVLKSIGMLNASNEPTQVYQDFMHLQGGASALAPQLRREYEPLFNASHEPWKESSETLKNLFNIHSGGSDRCIEHQIQTFKAIAENTIFDDSSLGGSGIDLASHAGSSHSPAPSGTTAGASQGPAVNINVHIHLPDNKSRRDYECMIEDIGRYIFGREPREHRDAR